MNVGELLKELSKFDKSDKILIYPEIVEFDINDNPVGIYAGGISICTGTEHHYLGDADFAQEIFDEEEDDDELGFELDDEGDDELDYGIEFEEERLN